MSLDDWRHEPVSLRQEMAAKFWGKNAATFKNRGAFSEWLDAWYAEDPRREMAWDRYKFEWEEKKAERMGGGFTHREDATRRDLAKIEFGIGYAYLEKEYARERPKPARLRLRNQHATSEYRENAIVTFKAWVMVIAVVFATALALWAANRH
jgi:hypothetical protein